MSRDLCRLCLNHGSGYMYLGAPDLNDTQKTSLLELKTIFLKLKYCVDVQISQNDHLSKHICLDCVRNVDTFYTFKRMCKNSEELQKSAILENTLEEGNGQEKIPEVTTSAEPPASTPAIAVPAKNEQQPVEKPNVSGSDLVKNNQESVIPVKENKSALKETNTNPPLEESTTATPEPRKLSKGYACAECSRSFKNLRAYRVHYLIHAKKNESTTTEPPKDSTVPPAILPAEPASEPLKEVFVKDRPSKTVQKESKLDKEQPPLTKAPIRAVSPKKAPARSSSSENKEKSLKELIFKPLAKNDKTDLVSKGSLPAPKKVDVAPKTSIKPGKDLSVKEQKEVAKEASFKDPQKVAQKKEVAKKVEPVKVPAPVINVPQPKPPAPTNVIEIIEIEDSVAGSPPRNVIEDDYEFNEDPDEDPPLIMQCEVRMERLDSQLAKIFLDKRNKYEGRQEEICGSSASSGDDDTPLVKKKCLNAEISPPVLTAEGALKKTNEKTPYGNWFTNTATASGSKTSKSGKTTSDRGEKRPFTAIIDPDIEEDADDPWEDPTYSPSVKKANNTKSDLNLSRTSKSNKNTPNRAANAQRTRPQAKTPTSRKLSSSDSSSDDEPLKLYIAESPEKRENKRKLDAGTVKTTIDADKKATSKGGVRVQGSNETVNNKVPGGQNARVQQKADSSSATSSTLRAKQVPDDSLSQKMWLYQISKPKDGKNRIPKLLVVPDPELVVKEPQNIQPPPLIPEVTPQEQSLCDEIRPKLNKDSVRWLSRIHNTILHNTCPTKTSIEAPVINTQVEKIITNVTNVTNQILGNKELRMFDNLENINGKGSLSDSSSSSSGSNKPAIRVKTPGELGAKSKILNSCLNDHSYFF